jgi:hypothetical protein
MSTVTAKIQICVSDNQAESIKNTTNTYRKACNWLSQHVFETKNLNQAQAQQIVLYGIEKSVWIKKPNGSICYENSYCTIQICKVKRTRMVFESVQTSTSQESPTSNNPQGC